MYIITCIIIYDILYTFRGDGFCKNLIISWLRS